MEEKRHEGELYKRIELYGRTFTVLYGFYDDADRTGKYNDPLPIYPDFLASPQYTASGLPFATAMQDACPHFEGKDPEDGCFGCRHYEHGEDLIGVCRCKEREVPPPVKEKENGRES